MLQKQKKLLPRVICCYFLAVFIPIVLLSFMIYHYFSDQRIKEYTTDRFTSLLMEQNSLENELDIVQQYSSQLQSDYELRLLLHGIYTSNSKVVRAYNTQIYSLLSNIRLHNPNIRDISIYTENEIAANLLKEFYPLSAQPFFENPDPLLRIAFDTQIFEQYANRFPDSHIYVYLNQCLIYQTEQGKPSTNLHQYIDSSTHLDTPMISLNEKDHNVVSIFSLYNGSFYIMKVAPESETLFSYKPFILSLLFAGFLLIFASIAVFLILFRAMHNIVKLSDHMKQQDKPRLTPYTGEITSDETGDLAISFNQMVQHINELSDSLLNSEIQLKNAQIESLQSQLNPHFFYGTLESIRMIAEINHQELISDIAFSFANLMRYSLSREYLVPIERELDVIRQYLSIQEKRLGNRFDVTWDIPDLTDKWRCPKFSIFNMIENVFSHNVSKCKDFIHIHIIIVRNDLDMTITVKNTGPGISPERLKQLQYLLAHPKERATMTSENNGRSIFNTSDRLKIFYGDGYYFSIESEPGKETTCSIRIHR